MTKTGTKNKWVGDGVVTDYCTLGRGTRISDSSGNKLWQLRLHTNFFFPLFIRPQLIIDEHQQLDCGNTTLTCFTSNATLTYPSQTTVRKCHQMKLSGRWPEINMIGCIQSVLFFRRHGHSRVRTNLCCKFHYPIKYIRKHLLFKFPIANETFGFHNRKTLTRTTC